jgi:nucleoside-diphosphate-sugar epimerase
LFELTGYRPATPLETGVAAFLDWYRAYKAAH